MEEALRAYLLAQTAIANLVAARIHWGMRPQGEALPGIVLGVVSRLPVARHSGPAGLSEARIQIDAYGATYAQARGLARALRAALSVRAFEQGGVKFQGAFQLGERDLSEAGATEATRVFRVSLDFQMWHEE